MKSKIHPDCYKPIKTVRTGKLTIEWIIPINGGTITRKIKEESK